MINVVAENYKFERHATKCSQLTDHAPDLVTWRFRRRPRRETSQTFINKSHSFMISIKAYLLCLTAWNVALKEGQNITAVINSSGADKHLIHTSRILHSDKGKMTRPCCTCCCSYRVWGRQQSPVWLRLTLRSCDCNHAASQNNENSKQASNQLCFIRCCAKQPACQASVYYIFLYCVCAKQDSPGTSLSGCIIEYFVTHLLRCIQ